MRQLWWRGAGRPRLFGAFDSDPGHFCLTSAARVAIVAPALLALVSTLVGDVRMSLFAWFGAYALLEFVDFDGPRPARLTAYLTLATTGAGMVVLGTLGSRSPWLAASMTAVVAFVVMFSGVLNAKVAVAGRSALLAFVLPVMTPGPISAIPERLVGWGLASVASITAAMLLWPRRPPDRLRAETADVCHALATAVSWQPQVPDPPAAVSRGPAADVSRRPAPDLWPALRRLRRQFVATAHRPTGVGGRAAALGHLVVDVNWLVPFALPWPERDRTARACFPAEAAELHAAVTATLRAAATRIEPSDHGRPRPRPRPRADGGGGGMRVGDDRLGIARLERSERAMRSALLRQLREPAPACPPDLAAAEAFRLRRLARGARELALNVLRVTGPLPPRPPASPVRRAVDAFHHARRLVRERGTAATDLAAGYASPRSVWFRNSVRGSLGLTTAVIIAQAAGLQHGFWVVLGTLSVLRSNAMATGSAAVRALAGTGVGIVVGGLFVVAVGTHTAVLWAVLPLAVLLGSYSRRRSGFVLGQAGFTVSVLMLFNIVEPAGWRVGIVRIQDVMIGFGVSIVVGALLWPRGAVAVIRTRAESAYRSAVTFLDLVVPHAPGAPEHPAVAPAAREAIRAGRLLDDAVRQFLAEQPPGRFDVDALMTIVAGALRIRRTAQLLWNGDVPWPPDLTPDLPRATGAGRAEATGFAVAQGILIEDMRDLCRWYTAYATALGAARRPPEPEAGSGRAATAGLIMIHRAARAHRCPEILAGAALTSRAAYLDILRDLQPRLTAAATALDQTSDGGRDRPRKPVDQAPGPQGSRPAPERSRAFIRAS
ncbi:conserved hypothetical protein [Parafrankia sp. EAN1pec]|uniref:FUSC family protein n=1 Tax=Parafrankia sp. (strain EAN1pec) TaxID=298653 RepID=UPI0000544A67|nr:conserved hypothetical protein [Frankia sp. EAN1pec]